MQGDFVVHNFSCLPHEAYVADGFVVHNCAYRMSGNVSNQMFGEPDAKGRINPRRMIPWAKVREILADCKAMGVKAVQFTGGGEPTVHPQHVEAFTLADDLGLRFALVTNGASLSAAALKALRRATWVRVSLDAGTAVDYARIRRVPAALFDRTLVNIEKLAELCGPVVGVGFVVTPDNWEGVANAARLAKGSGAGNIRLSAMFSQHGIEPYRPFYEAAAELCREAETLSGDGFTVYNRFGDRIEDLNAGHPSYPRCGYQRFTTYLGGDQNLYRCCNQSYNRNGLLGSFKEQSFRDLWESDAVRRAMLDFSPASCERCQFNEINHFLDEALADDVLHEEFV